MHSKSVFLSLALYLSILASCARETPEPVSKEKQPQPPQVEKFYHPMLYVSSYAEAKKLRQGASSSHAAVWSSVKAETDKLLTKNPPAYRDDEGEQLWQREVGNTIASLSFAGLVTQEQKYFDAASKWAIASCSYKTWGTDKTADGQEYGLAYGHQLLGLAMLYDYGYDYITEDTKELVTSTMHARCTRLYNAYQTASLALIQNHTWINICGLLSSAIVLRNDYKEDCQKWIEYSLGIIEKSSKLLLPDGASQEGPGYWEYGLEFLMSDLTFAKYLGKDFWGNSEGWWKNTAYYRIYHSLPYDRTSTSAAIVDWGDARNYSWYGPSHLFRALAALNNDGIVQYFAIKAERYDVSHSFLNMVWYDSTIGSVAPQGVLPTSRLFDDMGIYCSRTDWSGDETIFICRAGAPLGKSATSRDGYSQGDLGHVHPDAGHFIIYSNGEYILKNNGYMKRISVYHNTVTINGGNMWGQQTTYFTPWPLTPSKYPSIVSVNQENDVETVVADLSGSYQALANVSSHIRTLTWDKAENVLICVDDIEVKDANPVPVKLRFYPGAVNGSVSGNLYSASTAQNNVRIENLTSSAGTMSLSTQFIQNRSDDSGSDVPVIVVDGKIRSSRFVTAVSWGKTPSPASVVSYDESTGTVMYNGKTIKL